MTTAGLGMARGIASPQSLQNAPAAIGLAATKPQKRFGGKAEDDHTKLGMTMFFRVEVVDADLDTGGNQPLGDWSSCGGLSVKFNTEALEEGGEYDSPWHMPTKITYGEVTLERAIDSANAGKIETWLRQVANRWMKGDKGGSKEVARNGSADTGHAYSTTVVIELCAGALSADGSGAGTVVHRWELQEAIPVSYTGPTLSSKGTEVATEKLVLVHRGFASIAGKSTAKARTTEHNLTLNRGEEPDAGNVAFPYNPKSVALSKSVSLKKGEVQPQTVETAALDSGALSITIGNLRLEGAEAIATKVPLLLAWVEAIPPDPQPKAQPPAAQQQAKAVASATESPAPESTKDEADPATASSSTAKLLSVSFGNGISYRVLLKVVNVTYTRFSSSGVAIRADVNLTLQVAPEPQWKAATPDKSAPRAHTTAAGDTLPGVTLAGHRDPANWRDTAEANGIDDPMRVRPGQALRLGTP